MKTDENEGEFNNKGGRDYRKITGIIKHTPETREELASRCAGGLIRLYFLSTFGSGYDLDEESLHLCRWRTRSH